MSDDISKEPKAAEFSETNDTAPPAATDKVRQRAGLFFLTLGVATAAGVLYARSGPQAANASTLRPDIPALGVEYPVKIDADRNLANASTLAAQFAFQPARVQVPLMELKINPFCLSGVGLAPTPAADDPGETQRLEQQRQATLLAVQSLELQSILHGSAMRQCTINGMRYQEGQEAEGFLVDEIASNAVVVRKGVYRFELKLTK